MGKLSSKIRFSVCLVLCVAVCAAAFGMTFTKKEGGQAQVEGLVLKVWQIDCFEGGKGSRADFLQSVGNDFSRKGGCYINVLSLSSDAAKANLSAGVVPDIISYGAGIIGLESYITAYTSWCHGGYCLLSLDTNADFSDVSAENTVINSGKDNLTGAAALFCGLQGAEYSKPTGAYVRLINGDFKYLLGTQRDIYRLKTRQVAFYIKPVTQFNDLYQNISVTASGERATAAQNFIDYLLTRSDEVTKLGLLSHNTAYDDEMREMQGLTYEYRLTSPLGADTRQQLESAVANGDLNMLKSLLK